MNRCFLSCAAVAVVCALAASCSFDAGANEARGCDEQCAVCHLDYCLMTLDEANTAAGAGGVGSTTTAGSSGANGAGVNGGGTNGGAGTGASGMGEAGGTPTVCEADGPCFLGPAASRGVGACRDGTARCNGTEVQSCTGQVLPAEETCNDVDDDCDGMTDEGITLGSCDVQTTGACTAGKLVCQGGAPVCRAQAEPSDEICNGEDDDCDGEVDEDSDVHCYPAGAAGCEKTDDGEYECEGLCTSGMQTCSDGKLSACTGFVTPAQEACGGEEAADENCNGEVDDGCPCEANETQRCYSGPRFTVGIGRCRSGEQTCVGGVFGSCEGEVTPRAETCQNQGSDDNCNLFTDDVPNLGAFCADFSRLGLCRFGTRVCDGGSLVCETPTALTTETQCDNADEDCDGDIDETFALATDEQNCGACGVQCGSGQLCCAGVCRNINTNQAHCGGCNMGCGDGQGCCDADCTNLDTKATCGACNVTCTAGQDCCGGKCANLDSVATCGACNVACSAGQGCCGGSCKNLDSIATCGACNVSCTAGQDCCGGKCSNLDTVAACGSCDVSCTAGQACCDGVCANLDSKETCGSCENACPEACECVQGTCQDELGAACL